MAELKIPDGPFEGIIFDCDGTLADSMPIHYQAWSDAFRTHGARFDFTWETFYSLAGKGGIDSVTVLNERHGDSLDPLAVTQTQIERLDEIFHNVQPIPQVAALARAYHAEGKKISVASGGNRRHVHETLLAIGLADIFDVVVTQEDVARSKPAPDIFLLAAQKMGVEPAKCLVFEDSQLGLLGAESAGMQWVYVEPPPVSEKSNG